MSRVFTNRTLDAFALAFAHYVWASEVVRDIPHQDSPESPGVDMVMAEESDVYATVVREIEEEVGYGCLDERANHPDSPLAYLHRRMYEEYRKLAAQERAK